MSSVGSNLGDWCSIDKEQSSNEIGMGEPEKTQKQGNEGSSKSEDHGNKIFEKAEYFEQYLNEVNTFIFQNEDCETVEVVAQQEHGRDDSSVACQNEDCQTVDVITCQEQDRNEMDSCRVGSNASSVLEDTTANASWFDDRLHDVEEIEQMKREILKPIFAPFSVYNCCMSLFTLGILFLVVVLKGITFIAENVFATVYDICKTFLWSELRRTDFATMPFWLVSLYGLAICSFLAVVYAIRSALSMIQCAIFLAKNISFAIYSTYKTRKWRELRNQVLQLFCVFKEFDMEVIVASDEILSELSANVHHERAFSTVPEKDAFPTPIRSGGTSHNVAGQFEEMKEILELPLSCVCYFSLAVLGAVSFICFFIVLSASYAVTAVETYISGNILPALFDPCNGSILR